MSQDVRIKKKFIGNDAVDGEKILILNNQAVRAKKMDGTAAELYKLTDADKLRFLISPKFSSAPVEADDLSNKQYVDLKISSELANEESRALAAEAALRSEIAAETAEREASISSEAASRSSAVAAEAAARAAADSAEAAERQAADEALSQRIDAISVSGATTEYVDQQVASEQAARIAADDALAQSLSDSISNNISNVQSLIQSETTARQNQDASLLSYIQAVDQNSTNSSVELSQALDAETNSRIAGDAATLESANLYTDEKVAALVDSAPAVLDTLKELADALGQDPNFATSVLSAVSSEASRAQSAESALQTEIDAEEVARAAADSAESAARIAEDIRLQGEVDSEAAARLSGDQAEAAARAAADTAEAAARAAADSAESAAREAADTAEAAAREAADAAEAAARDAAIAVEAAARAAADTAEAAARQAGDSATLTSAQSYTDQKIADIIDSAPAMLDTLKELADAIGDDPNFSSTILSAVSTEQSRASSEEARIEAKVDAIQAVTPRKFTLSAQDISNQYIELPESAIMPHSVIANVDRLYLLPEELVQSTVSGKVRLTFAGAIASGGDQALVADDVLTVRYWVRS